MKRGLLFIFISFVANCPGQIQRIMELSEIPQCILPYAVPDVMGKVLVDEQVYRMAASPDQDTVLIFPGWPVNATGDSKRGGVYVNLDSDADFEVLYATGVQINAWHTDGSPAAGWPVSMNFVNDGPPAVGDINGDGFEEVVVLTRSSTTGNEGMLYAFSFEGQTEPGFPVVLEGGGTNSPVLGDLEGDGIYEIIIAVRNYPDGFIYIYDGQGSVLPGWPFHLDHIPASSVACGDIDGDSLPEIIAESYISVFALEADGQVVSGFPYTPGDTRIFSYSAPVLADLDGDGFREIIAGDHSSEYGYGLVHVLRNDGTLLPGWPVNTANWIYGPVSVADLNYDGSLDVICGDQELTLVPWCRVYAWDYAGNFLPGFPTSLIWSVNCQVIIGNLDQDKFPELIFDNNTNDGGYFGFNHDGTPLEGWPLEVEGSTFFINPFIADVNNDGITDLSGGGIDTQTGECNFYLWDLQLDFQPDKLFVPVFQFDLQHSGVFRMPTGFLYADFTSDTTVVEINQQVSFSNASVGEFTNLLWLFDGGDPPASVETAPVVGYDSPGIFDVTLIATGPGNADTMTKTGWITVIDPLYAPEIDSPVDWSAFPQPCDDFLYIDAGEGILVQEIEIYSASGMVKKFVFPDALKTGRCRLDISGVAAGIFFFRLMGQEKVLTGKLLIVK